MNHGVARHQRAGREVALAFEPADQPAGLAHQDDARRDVPGLQTEFPEAVEPAGRDVGEVEQAVPSRRIPATSPDSRSSCPAKPCSRPGQSSTGMPVPIRQVARSLRPDTRRRRSLR